MMEAAAYFYIILCNFILRHSVILVDAYTARRPFWGGLKKEM